MPHVEAQVISYFTLMQWSLKEKTCSEFCRGYIVIALIRYSRHIYIQHTLNYTDLKNEFISWMAQFNKYTIKRLNSVSRHAFILPIYRQHKNIEYWQGLEVMFSRADMWGLNFRIKSIYCVCKILCKNHTLYTAYMWSFIFSNRTLTLLGFSIGLLSFSLNAPREE